MVVSAVPDDGSDNVTGVVSRQNRQSIQVSMNRLPDGEVFRVDLTADEVTRQRQLSAIMTAKDSRGRLGHIRHVLMGQQSPEFGEPDLIEWTVLN